MSGSNSRGIQTLLEAEKEAAKVVQQAREYRTQKLKDARAEAAKEIEALKAQKEAEFKEFESKHSTTTTTYTQQLDAQTAEQLAELDKQFAAHKDDVVQKLLKRVVEVKPELHRNLTKIES